VIAPFDPPHSSYVGERRTRFVEAALALRLRFPGFLSGDVLHRNLVGSVLTSPEVTVGLERWRPGAPLLIRWTLVSPIGGIRQPTP
jgi:hypothetical protein